MTGRLHAALAERLGRATGLRNVVAHACGSLDMPRVHGAAKEGPADFPGILAALRRVV